MSSDFSYDLTVATVCRNALEVIPRCIASVLKLQRSTLKVEHLLIDGASTDGTKEYLQEQAKQGRITRLISEPDKGLYDAMNKAIAHAQGKIIVFINADDEICADVVPACCQPILQDKADYTVADAVCVNKDKEELFSPCLSRTLWRQPYCHQSLYCSTTLLRKIGGFHWENYRIGADTELMRRLYMSEARCVVVPGIASRFYYGGISSSAAVVAERYKLMLHFAEAYRTEVTCKPMKILAVIKHMRRYAARKIQQENHNTIPREDKADLTTFIQQVAENLPFATKIICQQLLFIQSLVYSLLIITTNSSKKSLYALKGEISRLFAKSI